MLVSRAKPARTDFALLILVLFLTSIGIPFVYDTSFPHALDPSQNPYHALEMQGMYGVIGLGLMVWAMMNPYWNYRKYARLWVMICGISLLAVFLPKIGIQENHAFRWIGHGQFRLQPSEFAKAALILFLANQCCVRPRKSNDWARWNSPEVLTMIVFAAAAAVEPDMGTATVLLGTGCAILFFAQMPKTTIIAVIVGMVAFGGALMGTKALVHKLRHTVETPAVTSVHQDTSGSFQLDRVTVWDHPDKFCDTIGYQVCHSRLAFGTGGALGAGFGDGREKFYLPEADTDFIFSTVGEEWGFAGSMVLLILFAAIVFRGINIAVSTKDPFGALLAAGISTMLGIQTILNIGTVISVIPATGVPLPFFSSGGSSLIVCLVLSGVLLNISRYPEGNPDKGKAMQETQSERDFFKHNDRQYRDPDTDWDYRHSGVTALRKNRQSRN